MTIDSKIRIRETNLGFLIEERYKFWFTYKWRIISTYRGCDTPFYFSSYEQARDIFIDELRIDIAYYSICTGEYKKH